jgi:phosphoribosyl-AMP cyclohydrolase
MKKTGDQAIRRSGARALVRVLHFDGSGLIPTVIQDAKTKRVLTVCYLNEAALAKSLATGTVYLYRRSHRRLMQKGETSGHIQRIKQIAVDCEGKSLVFLVQQRVAACHAGYVSCYFRKMDTRGRLTVTDRKVFDPKVVYTRS